MGCKHCLSTLDLDPRESGHVQKRPQTKYGVKPEVYGTSSCIMMKNKGDVDRTDSGLNLSPLTCLPGVLAMCLTSLCLPFFTFKKVARTIPVS